MNGRRRVRLGGALGGAVLALAVGLAGCSGRDDSGGKPPDADTPTTRMLYSPNGEPLNGGPLGQPSCREAMTRWFTRLAGSPQGSIDQERFLADTRAQFRRMDIDGNGFLVTEELERFRLPYRQPQPPSRPHHASGDRVPDPDPDPVMSADTGLDFKVTLEQVLAQARTSFARLDTDHDGRLTLAEIIPLCQPQAQR